MVELVLLVFGDTKSNHMLQEITSQSALHRPFSAWQKSNILQKEKYEQNIIFTPAVTCCLVYMLNIQVNIVNIFITTEKKKPSHREEEEHSDSGETLYIHI